MTHFSSSHIWCQGQEQIRASVELGADPEKARHDTPANPRFIPGLTYGGDGGDNLPQLQFVQDGSLASRIQANCNGEGHRMETGAREPSRDQGKGKDCPADGDGGGERESLQVRAALHLPGLKGSLGGECQLLSFKWPRR